MVIVYFYEGIPPTTSDEVYALIVNGSMTHKFVDQNELERVLDNGGKLEPCDFIKKTEVKKPRGK